MSNAKRKSQASLALLAHLPQLAEAMQEPGRTEHHTRGTVIKKRTKNGYSLSFRMAPYPNDVELHRIDPRLLRELGHILMRISDGEDARIIFRQNAATKPKQSREHFFRALAYWSIRALNPAARRDRAVKTANSILPGARKLKLATVVRIAGDNRETCLRILAMGDHIKPITVAPGKVIQLSSHVEIQKLREYLRSKSE